MKRYYILLLGLCMMSSIQAQDNDPRKAFDRFAQRSKQKFDDFRSRANEQYAEAMKRAAGAFCYGTQNSKNKEKLQCR